MRSIEIDFTEKLIHYRTGVSRVHPQLSDAVHGASQALAGMNAERLAELAESCRLLADDDAPEEILTPRMADDIRCVSV